ncbi:MAG: hypothetical protein WD772_11450, partial [Pseudohongiellaceae bacterium]
MGQSINRRELLRRTSLSALGLAALPALSATANAAQQMAAEFQSRGRIKHSVAQWTYSFISLEEL